MLSLRYFCKLGGEKGNIFVLSPINFQGEGFDVMKSGDARVALIGFPSVGKVIYC